jgi:hypothetical protein
MTISHSTLVSSSVAAANKFNLNNDDVDATTAGGLYNVYFGETVGGADIIGNRNDVGAVMSISATQPADTGTASYNALSGQSTASADGNGGSGGKHNVLGLFSFASLASGGTNYNEVNGATIQVGISSGGSGTYKEGLQIDLLASDATAASGRADGIVIDAKNGLASSATGFDCGLCFGSPHGVWAIHSTGTMIGTAATSLGGDSSPSRLMPSSPQGSALIRPAI